MLFEASSDPELHVARLAVRLCSDLASESDVRAALEPIEQLLLASKGREAMPLAVQTLCVVARRRVDATLRYNPVIPLAAQALGKAVAGQCAYVAREALKRLQGEPKAYAQLLLAYACLELMARGI